MTSYYVSGTGNDSNNGLSANAPYRNIQTAVTKMIAGDTCYVMNGTYTSSNTPQSQGDIVYFNNQNGGINNPISLVNYPRHTPIIQGGANDWNCIEINNCSYINIDGITVIGNAKNVTLAYAQKQSITNNNGGAEINGSGITVNNKSHHVSIKNCNVSYCCGGGIGCLQSDYFTATNNTIFNNCNWTVYGSQGLSIGFAYNYDSNQSTYRMIVQGNKSYNNVSYIPWTVPQPASNAISEGHGLMIDTGYMDNAQAIPYTGKILFAENISHGNGGSGIQLFNYPGTASATIDVVNNTCFGNGSTNNAPEILIDEMSYVRLYNNILYAKSGGSCSPLNYQNLNCNNITFQRNIAFNGAFNPSDSLNPVGLLNITNVDPLFVSPNTGNFALSAGSPAIGNADATFNSLMPVNDIGALQSIQPPILVLLESTTIEQSRGISGTVPYYFIVNRLGNTELAITVNYAVTPSGYLPASAIDFTGNVFPSGTVTIPSGNSSIELPININGTSAIVTDKTFTLTISAPSNGVIAQSTALGTILSSSSPVITVENNVYQNRGISGNTPYTFVINRTGVINEAVTLNYACSGTSYSFTAASPSDFAGNVFPSGAITFAPGVTQQSVTIEVIGTTATIPNKEFLFYLINSSIPVAYNQRQNFGYLISSSLPT